MTAPAVPHHPRQYSSTALARMPRAQAIDVLRTQIAPKASDDELAYFAQVCARLDLSPFADQIVLIGRWDSRVEREVHRHQITVAGRRALATRTGQLAQIDGPVWCGPRARIPRLDVVGRPVLDEQGAPVIDRGPLEWTDLWDDDDGAPYAARVLVHRHDWTGPANGTAKWSEFRQVNSKGKLLRAWDQMPSHMLGKVAESMALRRAFPDTITPDAVDGFDDVALAYGPGDDDRALELEDAGAGVEDALDVSTVEVRGDTGNVGVRGPEAAAPRTDRTPAPAAGSQAAAHKVIGALDEAVRDAFLRTHGIEAFELAWPAAAVEDALARPF